MTSHLQLLQSLQKSLAHNLTVYIKLRHQQGEIMTIVKDIIHDDIVMVTPVTVGGLEWPRTSFYLEEIESVAFARIFYNATLYARLRDFKGNLKNLQEKLHFTHKSEEAFYG